MKKLSKEVESKTRSLSVIAKLMGLEGMPSPRRIQRWHKKLSDSHREKNAAEQNIQLYDCQLGRRSSIDHQQFKDVYEDFEASNVSKHRCSSRWGENLFFTESELPFVGPNCVDANYPSSDDSKEFDDTLEMPDLNYGIFPDSSSVKHFHDVQVDSGSRIAVLKPSNSKIYERKVKSWGSKRVSLNKRLIAPHPRREDGFLLEPHYYPGAHISHHSPRIQQEEKNEDNILPTTVVILKPNLGKMHNAGSPPNLSINHQLRRKKNKELPNAQTVSTMRSISVDARVVTKETRMRNRNGLGVTETVDMSVGFRGYVGDESSYDGNDSDSENELKVFKLFSRKFDNNLCRYPSSRSGESSVYSEAKKRLCERWKMTHKYQDLEIVSKGRTLGEMLALADGETRPAHLNGRMSLGKPSNQVSSCSETEKWSGPLGISSKDGWMDNISRNSSRSRSLPPSRRGRNHMRCSHHDELTGGKLLMPSYPLHHGGIKVAKETVSHMKDNSLTDPKSRNKNVRPHSHIFINETNSSPEANFDIMLDATTEDVTSKQQSIFQMAVEDSICRSPTFDVMMTAELESLTLPPKSFPKQMSAIEDGDKYSLCKQEDSQEMHGKQSPSLNCLGAESGSDPPGSSKDAADHSSPISVLEIPFTEDASFESFEQVSAELHELQKQLQLLKMESGPYSEVPDEVAKLSPIASEEKWKSAVGPEDWELSYSIDVLTTSGLEKLDINMPMTVWHSPDIPLDPMLFHNLEKKYNNGTSGLRSERRFLFDRINSALLQMFNELVSPWEKPKSRGLKRTEAGVIDSVVELVKRDDSEKGETVSYAAVDMELQWLGSKGQTVVLGNDIAKLLMDDIIREMICG